MKQNNYAKFLIVLVCTIMLLITLVTPVLAENETSVNFRTVLWGPMKYANCSVWVAQYASPTDDTPINSFSFAVSRVDNWQFTKKMSPGYYKVTFVSIEGQWQSPIFGHTDMFEVHGDKMTVYIAVQDDDDPVNMPDEWLVYGEDTQNFYIWETESTNDTSDIIESNDTGIPNTSVNVDDLPGHDTDIDVVEQETRHDDTLIISPAQTDSVLQDERPSVQIGNIIYTGLTIGLLITSVILLHVLKKRRGA